MLEPARISAGGSCLPGDLIAHRREPAFRDPDPEPAVPESRGAADGGIRRPPTISGIRGDGAGTISAS